MNVERFKPGNDVEEIQASLQIIDLLDQYADKEEWTEEMAVIFMEMRKSLKTCIRYHFKNGKHPVRQEEILIQLHMLDPWDDSFWQN